MVGDLPENSNLIMHENDFVISRRGESNYQEKVFCISGKLALLCRTEFVDWNYVELNNYYRLN